MNPLGVGSTTLHFDWLWFSLVVSVDSKEVSLVRDGDYTYLWYKDRFLVFRDRVSLYSPGCPGTL